MPQGNKDCMKGVSSPQTRPPPIQSRSIRKIPWTLIQPAARCSAPSVPEARRWPSAGRLWPTRRPRGPHNATMGIPLLVLDMYEHSYHMDFGAAAARYVDAFLNNVQWDEVNRRVEQAQKIQGS